MMSGSDHRDREQDRLHPVKRYRPIAAGQLSVRTALIAAAVLATVGIGSAFAIAPTRGLVACGYLLLTASYSLWWRRVVIAAHGNSLRALVKYLDGVSEEEIVGLNIPTGIPLVYELEDDLRPIRHYYLGDPEAARKAAEAVANQAARKP